MQEVLQPTFSLSDTLKQGIVLEDVDECKLTPAVAPSVEQIREGCDGVNYLFGESHVHFDAVKRRGFVATIDYTTGNDTYVVSIVRDDGGEYDTSSSEDEYME
jgi:hypothetical protein